MRSVFKLLVLDFFSMANKSENCVFLHSMANEGQNTPDSNFGLMSGLRVGEARLVKRDAWNKIQDCPKQLLKFSPENKIFLFGEDELKKLN